MSEKKKEKPEQFTSKKGNARYPYITKADFHPEYSPEGVFKVTLEVDGDDAKADMDRINKIIDAEFKLAVDKEKKSFKADMEKVKSDKKKEKLKADRKEPVKAYPYFETEDDDGEETGGISFNFKLKAKGKNPKNGDTWDNKVIIFDAKKNPVPKGVSIWAGSTIKVVYEIRPYFMASTGAVGVTLDMKVVQVIKLVTGNGGGCGNADDYGLEEEEGDDLSDMAEAPESSDDGEDESEEDF